MWTQPQTLEQLDHMLRSARHAGMFMWHLHKEYPENPWYELFMHENKQVMEELRAMRELPRFKRMAARVLHSGRDAE